MPYPNEHSCRVRDPADFVKKSYRRKNIVKGVDIILGQVIGTKKYEVQAYRFDTEVFTASEAKAWLKKHEIKCTRFEAAK